MHLSLSILQDYRVFGTMRVGITSVPREEDMTEEPESGEMVAKVSSSCSAIAITVAGIVYVHVTDDILTLRSGQ